MNIGLDLKKESVGSRVLIDGTDYSEDVLSVHVEAIAGSKLTIVTLRVKANVQSLTPEPANEVENA